MSKRAMNRAQLGESNVGAVLIGGVLVLIAILAAILMFAQNDRGVVANSESVTTTIDLSPGKAPNPTTMPPDATG